MRSRALYTDILKLSLGTKPSLSMMWLSLDCGRSRTTYADGGRALDFTGQHFHTYFTFISSKNSKGIYF